MNSSTNDAVDDRGQSLMGPCLKSCMVGKYSGTLEQKFVKRTMYAYSRRKMSSHTLDTFAVAPNQSPLRHFAALEQVSDKRTSDSGSMTDLGNIISTRRHINVERHEPRSVNLFCRNHFHLLTPSSVITLRTSSSVASLPSLTQAGSGQPTRPTSPSVIHRFQKSSKQGRQNTWEHDSETHLAPLTDVRHISQLYDVCENRACCIELSCSVNSGIIICKAGCGIL